MVLSSLGQTMAGEIAVGDAEAVDKPVEIANTFDEDWTAITVVAVTVAVPTVLMVLTVLIVLA